MKSIKELAEEYYERSIYEYIDADVKYRGVTAAILKDSKINDKLLALQGQTKMVKDQMKNKLRYCREVLGEIENDKFEV